VDEKRTPTVDELSRALSEVLKRLDVRKEYALEGGGLKHGDVAWEIAFVQEGLKRYIFLTAHNDHWSNEVVVRAQVAATDGHGHWSHLSRGNSRCDSVADLTEFVTNILSDGILKASSIPADALVGIELEQVRESGPPG
jgi:orotate phosphoribosyltransferase-like protein